MYQGPYINNPYIFTLYNEPLMRCIPPFFSKLQNDLIIIKDEGFVVITLLNDERKVCERHRYRVFIGYIGYKKLIRSTSSIEK